MSAILEVKNLTHTYGDNTLFVNDAVSNVSFTVSSGEIIGIIGHTGSGKSTLVQHINGLLKPTSGQVLIDGVDIWKEPKKIRDFRFKAGLVFQYPEYQLFEKTVYEDIAFGPQNMGLDNDEIKKRVMTLCRLLEIPDSYLDKSPFDLSGGEKRRVAIAGVMAMQPKIIIFDEPVAGLDPRGRSEVLNMITNYRNAFDATVLIISHNMEDMAILADKLLVMNKGKLEMFDTVENVFSNYTRLFEIGLDVPMITKIMQLLKKKGLLVNENIFTVSKAVENIALLTAKGGAL